MSIKKRRRKKVVADRVNIDKLHRVAAGQAIHDQFIHDYDRNPLMDPEFPSSLVREQGTLKRRFRMFKYPA